MSETTMDVRTALDHLRSYYTRNVKPFRELLDVLEVAASVNDALPTAQAELAKLEGEIPVARAQLATIAQEVLTAKDHAATAIRRCQDDERAARTMVQNIRAEAMAAKETLEATYQAREADLRTAHEALVKEFAEIIAREQKTLTEMEAEQQRYLSRFGR